jgi:RNA polymerase sigma-70 factor, ECF subfamily
VTLSGETQPQPQTKIDAETIRRAQQGDHAAFERIYELHSRRVYSLCLRMVGNSTDAEDLTQEAFLQLFRKIGTFRGESAFSTWLHRLVFNVVLMRLRRRRFIETSLDEALDPGEETGRTPMDFGRSDPRLTECLDRMNLDRALEQLPPGYRSIFVLHDVLGYEHHEIAAILQCSVGNSKSQLHKARLRLRPLLETGESEIEPVKEMVPGRADQPRSFSRMRVAVI